jgi:hypothetical protein
MWFTSIAIGMILSVSRSVELENAQTEKVIEEEPLKANRYVAT